MSLLYQSNKNLNKNNITLSTGCLTSMKDKRNLKLLNGKNNYDKKWVIYKITIAIIILKPIAITTIKVLAVVVEENNYVYILFSLIVNLIGWCLDIITFVTILLTQSNYQGNINLQRFKIAVKKSELKA